MHQAPCRSDPKSLRIGALEKRPRRVHVLGGSGVTLSDGNGQRHLDSGEIRCSVQTVQASDTPDHTHAVGCPAARPTDNSFRSHRMSGSQTQGNFRHLAGRCRTTQTVWGSPRACMRSEGARDEARSRITVRAGQKTIRGDPIPGDWMRGRKARGTRVSAADPDRQTAAFQTRRALMNRATTVGTAQIIRVA